MATIKEMNPGQQIEWDYWVSEQSPSIQTLAHGFPQNSLFLLKGTGLRVFPVAYNQNGTMTVSATSAFNQMIFKQKMFERRVFGVRPDDLGECDA